MHLRSVCDCVQCMPPTSQDLILKKCTARTHTASMNLTQITRVTTTSCAVQHKAVAARHLRHGVERTCHLPVNDGRTCSFQYLFGPSGGDVVSGLPWRLCNVCVPLRRRRPKVDTITITRPLAASLSTTPGLVASWVKVYIALTLVHYIQIHSVPSLSCPHNAL